MPELNKRCFLLLKMEFISHFFFLLLCQLSCLITVEEEGDDSANDVASGRTSVEFFSFFFRNKGF